MERFFTSTKKVFEPLGTAGAGAILAFLLVIFTGCASRHHPSEIHPYRTERFQENRIDMSQYKSPQERGWGQDPNTALAVAISGGGHRATNFGVGVLIELEKIKKDASIKSNALNEIDYFSTVSGGGLAAAAYISSLHDYNFFRETTNPTNTKGFSFGKIISNYNPSICKGEKRLRCVSDPELRSHLGCGYHKDLLEGLFAWTRATRGEFLERAFDNQILGRNWRRDKQLCTYGKLVRNPSLTLGDVFVSKSEPNRPVTMPYWVANATVYENGSIFPFTPDFLKLFMITGYKHRLKQHRFKPKKESYESFINNVPLALGLTASGNFPVLIPATTLESKMDPKNPYLHLLDGGMADNLGIITALRLLSYEETDRKVLLVVDAFRENAAPFSNTPQPPLMADTVIRAMHISLDSWRGRAREIVRAMNTSEMYGPDIKTVFISFDDLCGLETFEELFKFGLTQHDLDCLKEEGCMDKLSKIRPYSLVRTVKTRYNLSPAQQNLLFAAGRYITNKKADVIKRYLHWTDQPEDDKRLAEAGENQVQPEL